MHFKTIVATILSAAILVSAAPVALDAREPSAEAYPPSWKREAGAPAWKREAGAPAWKREAGAPAWKRDAASDWKREAEPEPEAWAAVADW